MQNASGKLEFTVTELEWNTPPQLNLKLGK